MPDGTYTGKVIAGMLTDGQDVRVIDNTPVASLLTSREFLSSWGDIYGLEIDDMLDETFRHPAKDALFHATNSPWADASKRFADASIGDVHVIAPNAGEGRVFAVTELQALLDNPSVTSVDGVPMDELFKIRDNGGLDAVFKHVRNNSLLQVELSGVVSRKIMDSYLTLTPDDYASAIHNDPIKITKRY